MHYINYFYYRCYVNKNYKQFDGIFKFLGDIYRSIINNVNYCIYYYIIITTVFRRIDLINIIISEI